MAIIPREPTTDFTSTTLNGSINASQTTITVNDASTIQTPTYAVVDREDNNGNATPNQREVVYISSKSGNDLTVTRGVNNSTARAHNDSAKFEPLITVGFWGDFYTAYDNEHTVVDGSHDITKVAVLSGATVQTVANKILSGATIITPTMTLLNGASVAPTVEGDIRWRTGDDAFAIGSSTETLIAQMGVWQSFSPAFTGFSADPTVVARYALIGKTCIYAVNTTAVGTSNANTFTITAPFVSANIAHRSWVIGQGQDNGSDTLVVVVSRQSSNVIDCLKSPSGSGSTWTTSGSKYVSFVLIYQIA